MYFADHWDESRLELNQSEFTEFRWVSPADARSAMRAVNALYRPLDVAFTIKHLRPHLLPEQWKWPVEMKRMLGRPRGLAPWELGVRTAVRRRQRIDNCQEMFTIKKLFRQMFIGCPLVYLEK